MIVKNNGLGKRLITRGSLAAGAVAVFALAVAPVSHAMGMTPGTGAGADGVHIYETTLNSLNGSGAYGKAVVVAQGDQATVAIRSTGLSANLPHAEHIHLGDMDGTCPTPAADKDGDGFISVLEAAPNYGPIKVSLTTNGDYSAASALAVDRFPVADNGGNVSYLRTFTLPQGVTAGNLADGVIVQHGISKLFADSAKYDGSKPSELDASLPFEATVPADCGALTEVTPMAMNAAQYPQMFDQSVTGALATLDMNTSHHEAVTAFRQAYDQARTDFGMALQTATSQYGSDMMNGDNGARDHYVDAFNHAKSDYFGALEQARNALVDHLSGSDDVAKDTFVNAFNSARDMYGNQLEMVKNQF